MIASRLVASAPKVAGGPARGLSDTLGGMRFGSRAACALLVLAGMALSACDDSSAPGTTFYEREIQPILDASCVGNVGGCHAINEGDPFGFAAGNLDLTSFEALQSRRDTLRTFGAYPVPLMLIKAVGATCELQIPYQGEFLCIDVPHAGGSVMQVGSPAYLTLLRWMENGATENGLPPAQPPASDSRSCSTTIPGDFSAEDEEAARTNPNYQAFIDEVQPILTESCNSGNCHGTPQADFYITCGLDARQQAFNFTIARNFVSDPVANSEILQRPLSVQGGGYGHTGGDQFSSRNDPDYAAVSDWAEAVGPIDFGEGDPGREFFEANVQPLLLSRGCSFEACHSPQAFNDFKLRQGSQGAFSARALERNYGLLKNGFMAMEFADARNGRAVAKGILASQGGIDHRGGASMQTPGQPSLPSACPDTYDPATASAFCTFQEWVNVEREGLLSSGQASPLGNGDTVPIVYVDRAATSVATPLEFATYQPDSMLMVADATLAADGSVASVGAPRALLDTCDGVAVNQATADISNPDVNPDGETIVFSMRTSMGTTRQIYTVRVDGSNCRRVPVAPPDGDARGLDFDAAHNFDPVWSPDGGMIVFASSAAGGLSRDLFLPQADIWRTAANGAATEQMTYLTNSEIGPANMRDGRVSMTTEKVSETFYQLAGRRINWDLTDYHPLIAQRSQSLYCDPEDPSAECPSVDYQQATEIKEASNNDFLLILSDQGVRGGAGTLAVFNRSVGTFEAGRTDPGYLPAMVVVDPAATGRAGATEGAYRSPTSLPDGSIMVSYTSFSGDLSSVTSLDFDIVATRPCIPPAPGATCTPERELLIGGPRQQVEAVLAIARSPLLPYLNRRQLVFGGGVDGDLGADRAVLHMLDAPALFTLLTGNLRRGRPVELFESARRLAVYRDVGTNSPGGERFVQRELLGVADLRSDGSARIFAPAGVPVVLELQDGDGTPLVTMTEAHQFGPGEVISMGVAREQFDAVCAGCHGSISGREIDVQVTPDALTGASESLSFSADPVSLD